VSLESVAKALAFLMHILLFVCPSMSGRRWSQRMFSYGRRPRSFKQTRRRARRRRGSRFANHRRRRRRRREGWLLSPVTYVISAMF